MDVERDLPLMRPTLFPECSTCSRVNEMLRGKVGEIISLGSNWWGEPNGVRIACRTRPNRYKGGVVVSMQGNVYYGSAEFLGPFPRLNFPDTGFHEVACPHFQGK